MLHYRVARGLVAELDGTACGLGPRDGCGRPRRTTKDVAAVSCRRCKKSDAYRRALAYTNKK